MACPFGAMCGAECIRDRTHDANHCGSCFNQCGSESVCVGGACVSGGGNGSSCASPIVWDVYDEEHAGFLLDISPQTTFLHPCGPLSPIPTKWFRFTGTKSNTSASVRSTVSTDRLVLTVFTSAACNDSVVLGCSNDTSEPSVDVPNAEDKTFYVAVGAVSVTAGASASIRVDH